MSGRVSEAHFQTADPAVRIVVHLDGGADGFAMRLSGSSLSDSFSFSHEDGMRLLGAIRFIVNSRYMVEEYCRLVSHLDPKFEVGTLDGRLFHFTLKGGRNLDMMFSFDMRSIADFFCRIRDALEEQVIRGVMDS